MGLYLSLFALFVFALPVSGDTPSTTSSFSFQIPSNTYCSGSNEVDLSIELSNTQSTSADVLLQFYKEDGSNATTTGSSMDGIESTITPNTAFSLAADSTELYHASYGGQLTNCSDRIYKGKIIANSGTVSLLASGWLNSKYGHDVIVINDNKELTLTSNSPTPTPTPAPTYSDNLIPTLTSNTSNGTVTSSHDESSSYAAWKAFDKDPQGIGNSWWSDYPDSTGWLAYEFNSPVVISKYTILPRTDVSVTGPKTWTFEGWNGSAWDILDTQSNITTWTNGTKKTFEISNTTAYSKYRINVSQNNYSYTCIDELEMMSLQ